MHNLILIAALLGQFRQELPEPKPQSTPPVAPKQVTPAPAPKSQDVTKGAGAVQKTIQGVQTNEPAKPIAKVTLEFHYCESGCAACPEPHAWIEKYQKDLVCPVRIVKHSDIEDAAKAGLPFVPCLMLVDDTGMLSIRGFTKASKHRGDSVCPGCINQWIRDIRAGLVEFDKPLKDQVVAAKPMRLPFRNQVRQAFDVLLKAKIGKFSAALHSNDGKRAIRVLGSNQTAISILAVCGGSGSFVLDAPGSLIPDGRLEFGYRMSGPNRGKLMFELPFDFDSPKAAACKEACGFGPLEILNSVVLVFKLLNVSADVALPADIALNGSFTGTSIAADFVEGRSPLVVINHLWTTERRFIGAEATEAGATVFSTVPFNKRKRIEFN